MCGRVTLFSEPDQIARKFEVTSIALEEFKKSYNISPAAKLPIVVSYDDGRRLENGIWGLERDHVPRPITNQRTERLIFGSFKLLLSRQRCIVPVNGFYEWGKRNKIKFPNYFQLQTKDLCGFSGVYDELPTKRFTIFTIKPNKLVAKVHDRMPVIVRPQHESKWLDLSVTNLDQVLALLLQYPAKEMMGYEVSNAVNKTSNDYPELIEPLKAA